MTPEWYVEASIGGWPGPAYSIRGCGGAITYEHVARYGEGEPEQVTLEVSLEELTQFWAAVETVGAWDWAAEYVDDEVLDGTHWSVTLEHQGKRMTSEGSNVYPHGFEAFCAAVSLLCGGRPFE